MPANFQLKFACFCSLNRRETLPANWFNKFNEMHSELCFTDIPSQTPAYFIEFRQLRTTISHMQAGWLARKIAFPMALKIIYLWAEKKV